MSLRRAISIVLLLAVVEGIAWWWMHPPLAGVNDPVLTWEPEGDTRLQDRRQKTEEMGDGEPSGLSPQPSGFPTSLVPRPDIYAQSAPLLRCSEGKVYTIDRDDGITVFLAYFEWNAKDAGSVLEAFRHMPEVCMGSVGFRLVEKAKPITYVVGDLRAETGSTKGRASQNLMPDGQGLIKPGNSEPTTATASVPQPSGLSPQVYEALAAQSGLSSSPPSGLKSQPSALPPTSLVFDHTIFRASEQDWCAGDMLHAFKAVWVSGMDTASGRDGLFGHGGNQLRTIRIQSALHRFRPAYTRVVQGAVCGAPDSETAWNIFEESMLKDIKMK